ncbi:hypothetical protein LTR84_004387 [Exophiala bonariae]|uniref:BZIP domain-containing protein n=1 Tax=Exophiala bonariae TaxID=1690606 RepID=A0AAV9N4P1_9EURO|nr:hypothetical protein LTR84_004387 [Exophiala bonariae]
MATTTSTPEEDHHSHDHDHSDTASQNQNASRSRRHSAQEREKLNRNTLNQRASRARRKDYVNSLESKVREYETQGVQATEEVQNAARRVAEENRVLKEEMRMLREHVRCLEEVLGRRGRSGGAVVEGVQDGGSVGDASRVGSNADVNMDDMGRQVELDSAWKRLQHEDRMRRREQFDMQMQMQQQDHRSEQPRWRDQLNHSHSSLLNIEDMPGDAAAVQYPSPPGDGEVNGQRRRHQHHASVITARHPLRPVDDTEFPHATISSFNGYYDAETDEEVEQHSNDNHSHAHPHTHTHGSEHSSHIYSPYSDVWTQQSYTATGHAQHQYSHSQSQHKIPSSSSSSSRSMLPANTTPCEEAALIIASMRGIGHTNPTYQADILPELGCDTTTNRSRSCTVDNARLFRIMDSDRV